MFQCSIAHSNEHRQQKIIQPFTLTFVYYKLVKQKWPLIVAFSGLRQNVWQWLRKIYLPFAPPRQENFVYENINPIPPFFGGGGGAFDARANFD